MNDKSKNSEIAVISKIGVSTPDVLNLDLTNTKQTAEILTNLIKSKTLGKVNTVEGAIGYYVKAKELGLPFISGIDHFFDIGGKTSLDVHAMRALVLKAGVIHWEEIYNNSPLYKYIDSAKQTIATGIDSTCLPDIFEVPKGATEVELEQDVKRIKSIGKAPVFKMMERVAVTKDVSVFNYATKYKFTRYIKFPNGTEKELIEYGEFSIKEAIMAGLHLKKDGSVSLESPWIKYPRNMLEHRAWTFGARKIADDILFGMLERTEALDMAKVPYTVDEGGVHVTSDDNQ